MKRLVLLLIIFAGCSPAPSPSHPLATQIWQEQTERIKAHEAFSMSDPTDWMAEYSARTNRVLVLINHPDRATVAPITFEMDAAFIAQDRPADLAITDAAEFDAAYQRAKELVEGLK